jgi:hypothetical protein
MSAEPVFNLSRPARASAEFVVVDEAGDSISWNVHPSLVPGIRTRLMEAVRRVPQAWLLPPQDGEVFDTADFIDGLTSLAISMILAMAQGF